jgi:L-rhamnose isomerase
MLAATKAPAAREIESAYKLAQARYAALGVNTDRAIAATLAVPVSIQCWQADDVSGLEVKEGALDGGGIQATGNYPGKARSGDEIRADFDQALKLLPGKYKCNIHAMYAETGGKVVDRNELQPKHFARWMDWAKSRRIGLDFNPTLFAHPMVKSGLTLSSEDKGVRQFWIEHCIACRKIGQAMSRKLGQACVTNIWLPDGRKDATADRWGPRERLIGALDKVLEKSMSPNVDAVESKLFGIGLEDYTVGSHEFYMLYAQSRGVVLCYDMGHFHLTESVADKVSSSLQFLDKLLIHVSRPVRWDSDHVVRLNDDLKNLCDEAVRGNAVDRIYWALDFFDASINRLAAWVVGSRALRKGLLRALLEPANLAQKAEYADDGATRLAVAEYREELPLGAVWDMACLRAGVPAGLAWLADVAAYEERILAERR